MPANSITFYIGQKFSLEIEALIKARLRRIAPSRAPAASMLVPLIAHPDPSAWAALLEDTFPDQDTMMVFLVQMVAASPPILSALQSAVKDATLILDKEVAEYKRQISEAADSLVDLAQSTSVITEENLDHPEFLPDAIEARLRAKLGGK